MYLIFTLNGNYIYFWWGQKDSYGLLWRELVVSKFKTVCCRLPSNHDDLKSVVYLLGNSFSKDDVALVNWYHRKFQGKLINSKTNFKSFLYG